MLRALVAVALLASSGVAFAHGGNYVPPPLRGPRGPRGPTTPGTPRPGVPKTPSGGSSATTFGADETPPSVDDWTRWWFANRRLLLPDVAAETVPRDGRTFEGAAWRERARVLLRAALDDADVDVSSAAAVALGKARDHTSCDALATVLRDGERDSSVREAAALGLALMGRGDAESAKGPAEALLDVAGDRRAEARLRAICEYALALRGDAGAGETLQAAVVAKDQDDLSIPAAGAAGLGMLGEEPARATLESLLAKRGDAHRLRRVYAAQGLARLGATESLDALRTACGVRDAHTRRASALALGVLARDDDKSAVVLAAMLRDDPDTSCRGAAAVALGRLGVPVARDALLKTLSTDDAAVRPYAALGLGLLAVAQGDAELVRPLVALVEKDEDDSLRGAAACALGMSGATYAVPQLLVVVQQRGDPRLRAHAAFALGRLGGDVEVRQSLRELLIEREHSWMPREAALALGTLRDRSSVRVLRRLMEDGPTLHVQAAGALALGSIGGDAAGAALVELLEGGEGTGVTRAMAVVALGRILDGERSATLAVIGADLDWHLFTPAVQEILTIL